jgi:hypothetical protein
MLLNVAACSGADVGGAANSFGAPEVAPSAPSESRGTASEGTATISEGLTASADIGLLQKRILTFNGQYFSAPLTWYSDTTYPRDDANWCIWGALATAMLYDNWPLGAFYSGNNGQQVPDSDYTYRPYYFNYSSLLAAWPAGGALNTTAIVPLAPQQLVPDPNYPTPTRTDAHSRAIDETARLYQAAYRATGLAPGISGADDLLMNASRHSQVAHILRDKLGFIYAQSYAVSSNPKDVVKNNLVNLKQPVMVLALGHAYWLDGFKTDTTGDMVRLVEAFDREGVWKLWTDFVAGTGMQYPPVTVVTLQNQTLGSDGKQAVTLYYGDAYVPSSGGKPYLGRLELQNTSTTSAKTITVSVKDKSGTTILPQQSLTFKPGAVRLLDWFQFSVPTAPGYQQLVISFGGDFKSFKLVVTDKLRRPG